MTSTRGAGWPWNEDGTPKFEFGLLVTQLVQDLQAALAAERARIEALEAEVVALNAHLTAAMDAADCPRTSSRPLACYVEDIKAERDRLREYVIAYEDAYGCVDSACRASLVPGDHRPGCRVKVGIDAAFAAKEPPKVKS